MPDYRFKQYRRKQIAELRPYIEGEDVSHVSISPEDAKAGSPKPGDMIARNPKNHADQWLVARDYFLDNFEPLTAAEQAETATDAREVIKDKEIAALRKAMELARAVLARSLTAGYNVPGPTQADIEKAFWALDAALKSAMETRNAE